MLSDSDPPNESDGPGTEDGGLESGDNLGSGSSVDSGASGGGGYETPPADDDVWSGGANSERWSSSDSSDAVSEPAEEPVRAVPVRKLLPLPYCNIERVPGTSTARCFGCRHTYAEGMHFRIRKYLKTHIFQSSLCVTCTPRHFDVGSLRVRW
jgi:hypothetical protein